jgi:hypothetical protein
MRVRAGGQWGGRATLGGAGPPLGGGQGHPLFCREGSGRAGPPFVLGRKGEWHEGEEGSEGRATLCIGHEGRATLWERRAEEEGRATLCSGSEGCAKKQPTIARRLFVSSVGKTDAFHP